jgi:hypothetical protein
MHAFLQKVKAGAMPALNAGFGCWSPQGKGWQRYKLGRQVLVMQHADEQPRAKTEEKKSCFNDAPGGWPQHFVERIHCAHVHTE